MHRRELPIRSPCSVPLDGLYCATCRRDVIDMERLTAAEARALRRRARAGERVCVRYRVDGDGLIQLRPRLPPIRATLAAAGLASLLACGTAQADVSVPGPPPSAGTSSEGKAPARAHAKPKKPAREPAPPKKPEYEMLYGGI